MIRSLSFGRPAFSCFSCCFSSLPFVQAKSLVPHVFPACGHVQGYAKQLAWGPCPMCRTPGPLVEVSELARDSVRASGIGRNPTMARFSQLVAARGYNACHSGGGWLVGCHVFVGEHACMHASSAHHLASETHIALDRACDPIATDSTSLDFFTRLDSRPVQCKPRAGTIRLVPGHRP